MVVDDLLKRSTYWLSVRKDTGIVISSRVRLARNIHGAEFPERAGDEECCKLLGVLGDKITSLKSMSGSVIFPMDTLGDLSRNLLCERRLISEELADKTAGSGLVLCEKRRVAVMINEEDHIRFQAMRPGKDLRSAWKTINTIETELEQHLRYAFSTRLGYLTACPSNVGTGLRASVMMHLPGLKLQNEMDCVVAGINRIGLVVRGAFGEGTESFGNMFQISNQTTLGEDEESIIDRLMRIVEEIVLQEMNARGRLMEKQQIYVLDYVSRAIGILQHARIVSSEEAMDLLSGLRLGIDLGIVSGVTVSQLNELILLTQPAHLQKKAKKELDPKERDQLRAEFMRKKLKPVSMVKEYI